MNYQLHHGDCLDIMPTLEAGSVPATQTKKHPLRSAFRQTATCQQFALSMFAMTDC
jgi:hypothetical protein